MNREGGSAQTQSIQTAKDEGEQKQTIYSRTENYASRKSGFTELHYFQRKMYPFFIGFIRQAMYLLYVN